MAERPLMLPEIGIGFTQRKSELHPIFRSEGCRFRRQLFQHCELLIAGSKSLQLCQAEIETGSLRREFYRFLVGMARLCKPPELAESARDVGVCLGKDWLE